MNTPLFPIVRNLLSQRPTPVLWQTLCGFLEEMQKSSEFPMVLEYLKMHLDAWPAELRVLPWGWREQLVEEEAPLLEIVGSIDWAYCTDEILAQIASCPHLERLEAIRFLMWDFSVAVWEDFLNSQRASQLKHLHLDKQVLEPQSDPSDILQLLTRAESLGGLESLELSFWVLGDMHCKWFRDSKTLPEAIRLEYGGLEPENDDIIL